MNETEQTKIHRKITVEELRVIDDSWDICQPMYWTIDIYGTYEIYLESSKNFTTEQRYLLAINWYYCEVNNGGHEQFLFNSTGIVWHDAINRFKDFGMNDLATNLQRLIDYFGGTIPFNRAERIEKMEQFGDGFKKILHECNCFIYNYDGTDNEVDYIKANPELFTFEGCYYK